MTHSEIFRPRFTITPAIGDALARIERARAFLDAARLSEEALAALRARALLLEAHHTIRLEGSRLTVEQAEQILAGRAVPGVRPDDVRALLNHREAFEFSASYLGEGGALDEGLVREVHKRLVDGVCTGGSAPGEYRHVEGYVVGAVTRQLVCAPPGPADVPVLVRALLAWSSGEPEAHPVVVAAILQFRLAEVRPFLDGNGVVSRLIALLSLTRAGYDGRRSLALSPYHARDRAAVQRARRLARGDDMDLTAWVECFAAGVAAGLDAVRSRVEREAERDVAARPHIVARPGVVARPNVVARPDVAARHGLTERQAVAVRHILDAGALTAADLERLCPGVDRRSLQRELKHLVDRGLLRQIKAKNRLQYLPTKKLA